MALLPDTDGPGAMAVAQHLHQALVELAHPHEASPLGQLTASVGIATLEPPSEECAAALRAAPVQDRLEELLGRADAALYRAKAAGRSRSEIAES